MHRTAQLDLGLLRRVAAGRPDADHHLDRRYRGEDRAIWDRLLAPLESGGVLQAVDGDHRVIPGVRARHHPGHQVVEVSDGGASLLLSGDAINHPAQLQQPELATGPDEDVEGALRMRRMLLAELVDTDRVLAPSHFAEPFGRVVSDGPAGAVSWVPIEGCV